MPRGPERSTEPISPADLLGALDAAGGPTLYLSRGHGPPPRLREEAPEYVRVALIPDVPFVDVQAARARWLADAAAHGPVDERLDPAELAAPAADSAWADVRPEARAAVLTRGIAELQALQPELAVFHLTARSGGDTLLPQVRASVTGEGPPLPLLVLDHMLFGVLTHRSLRWRREARVVAEGPTWSIRQVFATHAIVWRGAVIEAPAEALGGLTFARLGELLVRARLARRAGIEPPASAPAVAAALAAAEALIAPWLSNLLAEGDRPPERN